MYQMYLFRRVYLCFMSSWNVKGVSVLFLRCWYMQSGSHYFALLFAFDSVRHAL